jgi:hypothetical protein
VPLVAAADDFDAYAKRWLARWLSEADTSRPRCAGWRTEFLEVAVPGKLRDV